MTSLPSPKIYVADLAAYNAGHLRGRWLDLSAYDKASDLRHAISSLLETWEKEPLPDVSGPIEEYRVDDSVGLPSCLLPRHGGLDAKKVMAFVRLQKQGGKGPAHSFVEAELHRDVGPGEWSRRFEECFLGTYKSQEAWARHHLEATGLFSEMPELVARYFDYQAFARDARLGGEVLFMSGGAENVYVFRVS